MSYASATYPDVNASDARVFAAGDFRRLIVGGAVIGLATAAAACAIAAVAVAAVWLLAVALSSNPLTHAKASNGMATIALAYPSSGVAADLSTSALVFSAPVSARHFATADKVASLPNRYFAPSAETWHEIAARPKLRHVAALTPTARAAAVPIPPKRPAAFASSVPLPRYRPPYSPPVEGAHAIDRSPAGQAAAQLATATPLPRPPSAAGQGASAQQAHNKTMALPTSDSRIALYDIAAHTVYLPNGKKLEAHSGLGSKRDDPRYVRAKNRGPTPPNVYDLTLREQLFHGVRAIRLNPVDEDKMFGRDGMLAHTYMLGRSGQSFGCVSFKDYQAFLRAYLNGEVDRLVVVAQRNDAPAALARARDGKGRRYASNN